MTPPHKKNPAVYSIHKSCKKTVNPAWSQEHFISVDLKISKAVCIYSIDKPFKCFY